MTQKKTFTQKLQKHTEQNLLLEIAEDERLRKIGIDPDSDPVEIMVKLQKILDDKEAAENASEEK